MKKNLLTLIVGLFMAGISVYAQTDKVQLSQDVSKKYKQNIGQLSQYNWKRNVQGFVEGNKVLSSTSSVTIGPDYKLTAITISEQSYVEKKRGIRGRVQANVVGDVNAYVKAGIELIMRYVYLSDGQMLDLFSKGTMTVQDNVMQVACTSLLNPGDQVNYKFDKTSLFYVSQDINAVMAGDAVKANVVYETLNGVNRVTNITVDLPKVGVNIKIANFEYAKKQ